MSRLTAVKPSLSLAGDATRRVAVYNPLDGSITARQLPGTLTIAPSSSLLVVENPATVPAEEFPPRYVGFTPQDYGNERMAPKGYGRFIWEQDRYEARCRTCYHMGNILNLRVKEDNKEEEAKKASNQTSLL